jgi:hypothetical protein
MGKNRHISPFLLLLLLLIIPAGMALADNCSSPGDCEETAGYNAILAVIGGILAAVIGLLGASLSGSAAAEEIADEAVEEVETEEEEEELSEEEKDRQMEETLVRDVNEFISKHPEYERIRDKIFKPDGTVNRDVMGAMMEHYDKYGPGSEYQKVFEKEQEFLRVKADDFFADHPEYQKASEHVYLEDGTIDKGQFRKILEHYNKYGRPGGPEDAPPSVFEEGLQGTAREIFTGRDAEGNFSWSSFILRGLLVYTSGGASEFVYTPGDALYRLKDGIDRGEEGAELYGKVAAGVILDEMIGRALGKGIEKGIGKLVEKFPGAAQNVGDFLENLKNKLNRPVFKPNSGAAPISDELARFKDQMMRALDSGDDEAVKQLFKNKGMDKLGQLESTGHLNNQQAQQLVNFHDRTTTDAIRSGTVDTIEEFGRKYGVKPDEIMVGNSGSTGQYRSVKTDADRTIVATFSDDAVRAHANANNMSMGEAAADLQNKFTNMHAQNVDASLQRMDLSAADMDTGSYSGFGSGAGPADSYPMGYTQSRQAIQGEAEVFRLNPDGSVSNYKTSGQSILDQNALNTSRYGGDLPTDPTRIDIGEMKPLMEQQQTAIGKYTDPKSLAKAVDRAHYAAGRIGQPMPDPNVVEASRLIRARPQDTQQILQDYGYTADSFAQAAKDMMNRYNPTFG